MADGTSMVVALKDDHDYTTMASSITMLPTTTLRTFYTNYTSILCRAKLEEVGWVSMLQFKCWDIIKSIYPIVVIILMRLTTIIALSLFYEHFDPVHLQQSRHSTLLIHSHSTYLLLATFTME